MNNILVADIFGKTSALKRLAKAIKADSIVDPYEGKSMDFTSEEQAYSYFMQNVGIDNYRQNLLSTIEKSSEECVLIGFSVGATITWMLSGTMPGHLINRIKRAVCYYGSQIRHYTELSPVFELRCIFPKNELHFDVSVLHNTLDKKENVTSIQVDYLHGFMNTHSCNFNDDGYKLHLMLLKKYING